MPSRRAGPGGQGPPLPGHRIRSLGSCDGGARAGCQWTHGVPTASVMDLVIHPRDHDLVIGTHGRAALRARRHPPPAGAVGPGGSQAAPPLRHRGHPAAPTRARGRRLRPGSDRVPRGQPAVRRLPQRLAERQDPAPPGRGEGARAQGAGAGREARGRGQSGFPAEERGHGGRGGEGEREGKGQTQGDRGAHRRLPGPSRPQVHGARPPGLEPGGLEPAPRRLPAVPRAGGARGRQPVPGRARGARRHLPGDRALRRPGGQGEGRRPARPAQEDQRARTCAAGRPLSRGPATSRTPWPRPWTGSTAPAPTSSR